MVDEKWRWADGLLRGRKLASVIIAPLLIVGAIVNLYFIVIEHRTYRSTAIVKYQDIQSAGVFWFDLIFNLFVLASCSILIWIMLRSLLKNRASLSSRIRSQDD